MELPKQLTTVTPFSKGLFLVLFIFLPFWAFYIGVQYEQTLATNTLSSEEIQAASAPLPAKHATVILNAAQADLAQCISQAQATASSTNQQYEPGNILVSFASSTSFTAASKVIAAYDLNTSSTSDAKDNYNQNKWLAVSVPNGEEFRWICILKQDTSVRYAGVDPAFSLHD